MKSFKSLISISPQHNLIGSRPSKHQAHQNIAINWKGDNFSDGPLHGFLNDKNVGFLLFVNLFRSTSGLYLEILR